MGGASIRYFCVKSQCDAIGLTVNISFKVFGATLTMRKYWALKATILWLILVVSAVLFISSFNEVRPLLLSGGGESCLKELREARVSFRALGDMRDGNCIIKNAVRVERFKDTQLSSSLLLSCPTVNNLAKFFDDIDAKKIHHLGSYNCRKIGGSHLMSEHGYGTAIDISEIDSASVLKDWGKQNKKGVILRIANTAACDKFSNVLTPDFNKAHADHLHLDNGLGFGCLSRNFLIDE